MAVRPAPFQKAQCKLAMQSRYIRRAPPVRHTRAAATDRRRHDRLGNCPPLSVSGLPAAVYDVSRTGICLLVRAPLNAGEQYHLVLHDAIDQSALPMVAEVIWYRHGRAGLRWVDLSRDQDRWLFGRFEVWFRHMEGASRR